MSEETIDEVQQTEGTEQPNGGEVDYKALYEEAVESSRKAVENSRKWEKRAKANSQKAKAYDEAEAGKKTIEERLAALEGENADLKAKAEHARMVREVASVTGVPESVVSSLNGTDQEALTEQASAIKEAMRPRGGAPMSEETGHRDLPGKASKQDIYAIKNKSERIAAIAKNRELFN